MQAREVGVDSRPDVRTHLARLGWCAVYLAPSGLGPGGFMSPTVLVAPLGATSGGALCL